VRVENRSSLADAKISVVQTDEWGKKEQSFERAVGLRHGPNILDPPVAPATSLGRHYVGVILEANGKHYDWGSLTFDLPRPDEIVPLTTAEAQTTGNYAGWVDHRTFMEQAFAQALKAARDMVLQEDPGIRPVAEVRTASGKPLACSEIFGYSKEEHRVPRHSAGTHM